eukprot:1375803-Amorphochlora_amoeboformis.AAC.1
MHFHDSRSTHSNSGITSLAALYILDSTIEYRTHLAHTLQLLSAGLRDQYTGIDEGEVTERSPGNLVPWQLVPS